MPCRRVRPESSGAPAAGRLGGSRRCSPGAAADAGGSARSALARANQAYQRRFGRIYIVCAAGRSAEALLADIAVRMNNDPDRERAIAAEEQRKITRLRLEALMGARES